MIQSKYNHYFKNNDVYFIYNARTNALLQLDKEAFYKFKIFEIEESDENDLYKNLLYGGMIIPDEVEELQIIENEMYTKRFSNKSLGLSIAPTMECNFTCPYCYERDSQKYSKINEVTKENIVNYVYNKKSEISSLVITWYGGEPLLCLDDVKELSRKFIDICDENDIKYFAGITTNGYFLSLDIFKLFKNLRIGSIQIPLDGHKDFHDYTRFNKEGCGSFDKIIDNLKALKVIYDSEEGYKPFISIRLNVTRLNMDSMFDVLKELDNNNILSYVTPYVAHVFDDDDINNEFTLSLEEFNIFKQKFLNELENSYNKKLDLSTIYPSRIANSCSCDVQSSFVIDPDGNLYKCWEEIGKIKSKIGNINTGLDKFKNKNYFDYLQFNPTKHLVCKECNILPLCMGGPCPLRRVDGRAIDCKSRKKEFLDKMYISFKKLGFETVKYLNK